MHEGVSDNLVHYRVDRTLLRVLKQRNLCSKVVENIPHWGKWSKYMGVCAWEAEKLWHMS